MAGWGGSGGVNLRGRRYRPMAEINVTPFVDVMLVLLIVFMITAPLLNVGVQVDLPESAAGPLEGKAEPLTVSIDDKGRVFILDRPVTLQQLGPRLMAITKNRTDLRIFLRGDRAVDYGQVMRVMGALNAAGFKRVALVALPGDIPPAAASGGK